MLKVVIENIERIFDYLSKPTQTSEEIKRLAFKSLVPPLGTIDIGVLSNGSEFKIQAFICSVERVLSDPNTGQTLAHRVPLPLPIIDIPGLEIIEVSPSEYDVRKDGQEKFHIYHYDNQSFIVISAGLTGVPSGPTLKLESKEKLQEDLEIFTSLIEEVVNNIYIVAFSMAKLFAKQLKEKENQNDDKKDDKDDDDDTWDDLIINANKDFDDSDPEKFFENAYFNTESILYLRAPLSEDKIFDEFDDEDENEDPRSKEDKKNFVGKIYNEISPDEVEFGIDDVRGMEEQKTEILEVIDYMKNPDKYKRMGAKIPKGILFEGPPGTGKTMLARAICKESGVPCLEVSGSSFVEQYVGRGAARVRDLFKNAIKRAKEKGWCILFIDEIDAMGKVRMGGSGGNTEYEQTLNAILHEIDKFKNGVVIAATNRPDVIDPALLRSRRFDRKLVFVNPDVVAREEIFQVHVKNKRVKKGINFKKLARSTSGFTGADIDNLANEAALLAVRRNKDEIDEDDFLDSKDRIIMGAKRKLKRKPEELKATAYHEAGHAIIQNEKYPIVDPVEKVTIISYGNTLGQMISLPEEDKYRTTKEELLAKVCVSMGGRAAEFLLFNKNEDKISTGASQDIENATDILRNMAIKYGMIRELGPVNYGGGSKHAYLKYTIAKEVEISEKTKETIDRTVKIMLEKRFEKAVKILEKNRPALDAMAKALLEKETLSGDEVRQIIKENSPENSVVKSEIKNI